MMRRLLLGLTLIAALPARAGELGELLRASLSHPAVAASGMREQAAQAQLDASGIAYLGGGKLFADHLRSEDARFVGVLSPASLANPPFARELSRYGAAYQLPIDLAGTLSAGRRAAREDFLAARLAERQTVLLKLHEVTSAWVGLQTLQRQKQVLAVQRERIQQTVERIEQQVASEQAAIPELRLAEAELARQQSDEVRLDGEIEVLLADLEQASGMRQLPQPAAIPAPEWAGGAPSTLLAEARAQAQAAGAMARADQTRRALLPAVSAVADYMHFDGGGVDPEAWSIGATLSIPIDPAGWRRAQAADMAADAAAHDREAAGRQARRDWVALHAAWRSARADAQALEREIAGREEVVRAAAELQRVGMGALEDYLRQQRDLVDAEFRRSAADAQALISWSAAQLLEGVSIEHYLSQLETATTPHQVRP